MFQRELTVRTIQRLPLKSWYTNLQQKPLNTDGTLQTTYPRRKQNRQTDF